MNILMYGWEYPPNISGGLGVACYAIVQSLLKKSLNVNLVLPFQLSNSTIKQSNLRIFGYDAMETHNNNSVSTNSVYLVNSAIHPYQTPLEYEQLIYTIKPAIENYSKHHTDSIDFQTRHFTAPFSNHYGSNLFDEVLRYAKIAGDLALKIPHDVIHAHDWMTILAGINAKNISKKKLIFHAHALETDRSGIDNVNRRIFDIEKYGMETADAIIAVSNYTKNIIVKHYGISPDKINVVHNGIDADYAAHYKKRHFDKKLKTVLFLGRVTHQKGPYQFVEIASKILEKRKDIEFVIAGTGDLLKEMIVKVAAMKIGKRVHFTGFLDGSSVKNMFRTADVYVMPSVSEPFGISCLEALAHNVPVVISKQSGVIETLPHVLQADFWDIDEMAAKIIALLDYNALGDELIHNARREIKNITWERAGTKIINIYQSLISNLSNIHAPLAHK